MSELDEEITLCRTELQLHPQGHPNRADTLYYLADLLYDRFQQGGELTDLNEALTLSEEALLLCPKGHADRAVALSNVATYLHARFTQLGTLSDLDKALAFHRDALELRPEGHSDRILSLGHTADCLHDRFLRLGALSDLDEALALERSALELSPQDHPDQAVPLGNIANYLYSRFKQLGVLSDLDEAVALARTALELGHPLPDNTVGIIAGCLYSRFTQLGNLSDLEEALSLSRNVLDLLPKEHPQRATSLTNIAVYLHLRFRQLGTLSDLDEALTLQRSALELRPQGHPDRPTMVGNIANFLHLRFLQLGALSNLEEALALYRDVLDHLPKGHPQRAVSHGNVANCLFSRFKEIGMLPDLDEAISLQRNALELYPQEHPDRTFSMGNIAGYLHARFTQLGMLSDLDEALVLYRDLSELLPQGHPERATALGNVANCLHCRFKQLGTISDLDEALILERNALELRTEGHPQRSSSLANVAIYLHARFTELQTMSDLDEALDLQRSALELRPEGHPDRSVSLSNIAQYLHTRFIERGSLSDVEEALALEYSALELRPGGHPHRAGSLNNIANYLYSQLTQLETQSDLDEAISLQRNALDLRLQGHPERAISLASLARCLLVRFKHSTIRDNSDLDEAFSLYSQLSEVSQTVSSADLECAKEWIQAAEEYKHNTTVLAYQTFLRLAVHHLATLPSLPQHLALLKRLTTSLAADAFSACIRYGNPADAIELLEQGRGVFWNQLTRLRSPLGEVIASGDRGKKLAEKFMLLTSMLRNVFQAPPNAQSQHDRAYHLNIQLQDTIADMRKLPGFSRFLQLPLFSDLRVAAAGGPVIIVNASKHTCDALVLLSDKDPVHVALRITKARVSQLSLNLRTLTSRAKFEDMMVEFVVLLRELWDDVVGPVVEILRNSCSPRSRIWWCPTAEFSLLPLHAAGPYRKGQQKLSDLYISSYTPTLTALIRARQGISFDPSIEQHRFLLVRQAQAQKYGKLASVNTELSSVSQLMESHATVTCVQDKDADIAKVAEELNRNNFVHLACHGVPDRNRPFESGFALGDGKLRIENIMQYNLQNALFAYLSACHTTVGDGESPDEVIHLAAAMQFAGFRSVIGTMWAVDDAHTNKITSKFYANMVDENGRLDHTRAARALHKTMRSFGQGDIPFDQRILYIHIGA